MSSKSDSGEKLLEAVIELVAEKGYNGVSTKEIAAAAGVNEVTLFRLFGSKMNLMETAFHRFHYEGEMTKLFEERLVWDLQADLRLISRTYHETMSRNRKMMQIAMRDGRVFAEFREKANKHPRKLKALLVEYFVRMRELGKLIETDPEIQALGFMWMNYGAVVSRLNEDDASFPGVDMEAYIEETTRTFARALTP